MELTKEMAKVVAELEYIIGSECYNPNSYDGWNDIEGRDFRYPVNLPDANGSFKKVRQNLNHAYNVDPDDITPDAVSYMKYKFGSNELFIGQGIINTLRFLEERYGIDFNALEQEKK